MRAIFRLVFATGEANLTRMSIFVRMLGGAAHEYDMQLSVLGVEQCQHASNAGVRTDLVAAPTGCGRHSKLSRLAG